MIVQQKNKIKSILSVFLSKTVVYLNFIHIVTMYFKLIVITNIGPQ